MWNETLTSATMISLPSEWLQYTNFSNLMAAFTNK